MKNFPSIVLLAFFLMAGISIQAQDETLFNRGSSVGAFLSLNSEIGQINGETRSSWGGGIGLVVDNMFIGAYGLGSANYEAWLQGDDGFVDLAHGGLWFGYNYKTYKLLHLFTSAKVGWGAINFDPDIDFNRRGSVDGVFVITPEVGVELNITRWFRLAGTLNYRIVNDVEETGYSNSDFSGVNFGLTMRFGWFGRSRSGYDNM